MKTTAGSATAMPSITGATFRLMKETETESTMMSAAGFGMVSFHCTYRPAGTSTGPSGVVRGWLQALQVASGVRVLPERKAMAR